MSHVQILYRQRNGLMSLMKPFFDFTDLFRFHSNEFLQNCRWSIWTFCYAASMQQHTIRKFKFLSKNSILTKKTRYFHEFFIHIFFDIFSREIKAKKSKTTTFSLVFQPKKSTIFSGNQSWIFDKKWKFRTVCKNENEMYFWKSLQREEHLLFVSALTKYCQKSWKRRAANHSYDDVHRDQW